MDYPPFSDDVTGSVAVQIFGAVALGTYAGHALCYWLGGRAHAGLDHALGIDRVHGRVAGPVEDGGRHRAASLPNGGRALARTGAPRGGRVRRAAPRE